MFKRRKKKHFLVTIRDALWPSAGWRRAFLYLRHRLARIPGTPYAIAAGFACGVAVSFTPLLGLHFLLATLLAWIIGGNILTSIMGTVAGNPWTFPIIWLATYHIGCWLLGIEPIHDLSSQIYQILDQYTVTDIIQAPMTTLGPFLHAIFFPMFIGGLLAGAAFWIITYLIIEKLVREYKQKRLEKRQAAKGLSRQQEK